MTSETSAAVATKGLALEQLARFQEIQRSSEELQPRGVVGGDVCYAFGRLACGGKRGQEDQRQRELPGLETGQHYILL